MYNKEWIFDEHKLITLLRLNKLNSLCDLLDGEIYNIIRKNIHIGHYDIMLCTSEVRQNALKEINKLHKKLPQGYGESIQYFDMPGYSCDTKE